jgi:hypothetical protein
MNIKDVYHYVRFLEDFIGKTHPPTHPWIEGRMK